jgi:hypothetical protein
MSVYGWSTPEAGEIVERAAKIGRRLKSSADLAPSIANLAVFNIYRCRFDQTAEALVDLFRIARELDDPEIMPQAHHCAWPVHRHRGQFAQALQHCDAGHALYEEERDAHHRYIYFGHDPAVSALALGAQAQWTLGYPPRAMDRHDEAVTLGVYSGMHRRWRTRYSSMRSPKRRAATPRQCSPSPQSCGS